MSTTVIFLATQRARQVEEAPVQPVKTVRRESLRGITFGLSRFTSAMAYLLANGGTFHCDSVNHGLLRSTYSNISITGPEAAVNELLASASR